MAHVTQLEIYNSRNYKGLVAKSEFWPYGHIIYNSRNYKGLVATGNIVSIAKSTIVEIIKA